MGDINPKANGEILAAIADFAAASAANQATQIQSAVDKMVRDGILLGDIDLKQEGIDFEPPAADADNQGGGFGFGGGGDVRAKAAIPIVELPNYQLANARNQIRAMATLCRQAIGADTQNGLRRNLDAKAETLANSTVIQLETLLQRSGVGLINLDERRDRNEPTAQEEDQNRKTSYVEQLIKECEKSSTALADNLSKYTAE